MRKTKQGNRIGSTHEMSVVLPIGAKLHYARQIHDLVIIEYDLP